MHSFDSIHTAHHTRRNTQHVIRMTVYAFLAAFFLLALTGLALASPAAPTLNLTVDTGVAEGQSVRPGEVVTSTITLAYSGGSGPVSTGLLITLPDGAEVAGRPILEEIPISSVSPLEVKRRGNTVAWQGSLRNGGTLLLRLPLRVDRCWGGFRTLTIDASAQRPDGGKVQAVGTLQVHCPLATLDDIQVSQRVVRGDAPAWAPYDPGLLPGQGMTLRTTFRNNAPVPVLLGVSRPRLLAVNTSQTDAGPPQRITLLHLAPGESRNVDQALKPARTIDPASLLDGDLSLTVGVVYCLVTGDGRVCASTAPGQAQAQLVASGCGAGGIQPNIPCPDPGQIPDPTGQVTTTIPVRPNDLGDAPDSTNHAGQAMAAYPGVTAHFPTVYARLPGDPPGPLHRYPRPVHLGARVSMEAEADSGPDADPTNNILPGQDAGDRDRFDDGVKLSSLTLSHCQPARLQTRVGLQSNQVKQALLDRGIQVLYLNVWIDSNRDGDWNDTGPCSQQPGDLALEHIVIDHPVSVGQLTPGTNLVSVASNVKALWPANLANQPAWLRITLSEDKSPKLPNRTYGDGRGPIGGYRLGETEDSLWRPAGSPDVSLNQSGEWITQPDFGTSGTPLTDRYAQFQIVYENRGNAAARNVQIVQDVTGFGKAELVHVSAPGLPESAIQPGDGKLNVYIEEIPSGATGSILVGWRPQSVARSLAAGSRYTATVHVASGDDVDAANNSASTAVEETPILSMGFRTANSPVLLKAGTTCRSGVELVGAAAPGASIRLSVDGVELANAVTADGQGRWQYSLSGLTDGLHVVQGWWFQPEIGDEVVVMIRVDRSLPLDPASFTITDGAGRTVPVESLGRTWRNLRLVGNGPFQLGVTSCVDLSQVVSKYIGETEKNITLTDPDQDGRFTGVLDLGARSRSGGAVSLSLTVTNEEGETTFDAAGARETPGQVVDAVTGQPIAGAKVTLLVEQATASSSGSSFGGVPLTGDFGQVNPQTTGADGGFYFAPPPGVYRLLVSAPGYHSYRTSGVTVDDEAVSPIIRLTPAVSDPADVTVVMDEGGFEPDRLTLPPGTVVEWVNGDLAEHATVAELWDSGVLWPGEAFRLRFDETGTFTYGDGENPLNQGEVEVDPSAPPPGTRFIYLPVVAR